MFVKIKCNRCGHSWDRRKRNPVCCPNCKSPYWNKLRIRPKVKRK